MARSAFRYPHRTELRAALNLSLVLDRWAKAVEAQVYYIHIIVNQSNRRFCQGRSPTFPSVKRVGGKGPDLVETLGNGQRQPYL